MAKINDEMLLNYLSMLTYYDRDDWRFKDTKKKIIQIAKQL